MRGALTSVLCCIAFGFSVTLVSAANAGASDTDSVACGSSAASWNAPNGALVLSRSPGIVDAVLSAVGEHYTHSMLSHGPGGAVTHSTMFTPGTSGWPSYCSAPIKADELKNGYPGASRISQGGIYTFLYLDEAAESVIYQRSADASGYTEHGVQIGNFLLSELPSTAVASRLDAGHTLHRLQHHESKSFFQYVLYQYRDLQSLNAGDEAWNSGSVCSTFLAYAHHVAGKGTLAAHTYSHEQTVAAGDALYARVEDKCNTDTSFLLDAGMAISCFEGICDDAGRQIRNCMSRGVCNSDSNAYWHEVVSDPQAVAVSISPDRLGGWSGHHWEGDAASVWAYDGGSEVQWNAAGDTYGCWF
jgi:hypothetical protein